MTPRIPQRLAQFATVLALSILGRSLVLHHPDPGSAAEARYLTLLIVAVLLALGLSSRSAPASVVGGSVLALALFLPVAQGTRAVAVVALLIAIVTWHTWQTFDRARLRFSDVAAATVAWQLILRSERLIELSLEATTLIWALALPLVAAAAIVHLARRSHGPRPLLIVAGLILMTPGFGVVATAILLILAALDDYREHPLLAGAVIVAASFGAIWRLPAVAFPLLFMVAALALRPLRGWRWLAALGALAWGVLTWDATWGVGSTWTAADSTSGFVAPATANLGWIALAVPAAWVRVQSRGPLLTAAVGLLLIGWNVEPIVLAPALALLCMSVPAADRLERQQAGWGLGLLYLGAAAAAYPWLRHPVADLPTSPLGRPAVLMAVAIVALWALWVAIDRRYGRQARWVFTALMLVPLALYLSRPGERLLDGRAVTLTQHERIWRSPVDMGAVRELRIDSFLANSEGLDRETSVGVVRLVAANGERRIFDLRFGRDTADWAAARARPADSEPGAEVSPPARMRWVAPDGSLASRFQATWQLDPPFAAERVEIARFRRLPPRLQLSLLQVEVR